MSPDLIFELLVAAALATSVTMWRFRQMDLRAARASLVELRDSSNANLIRAERAESELRRIQMAEQQVRNEQALLESVEEFERKERVYRTSLSVLRGAVKATGALPVDEDVRSIVRVVRAMLDEIEHPTEAPKEPERLDDSGG